MNEGVNERWEQDNDEKCEQLFATETGHFPLFLEMKPFFVTHFKKLLKNPF